MCRAAIFLLFLLILIITAGSYHSLSAAEQKPDNESASLNEPGAKQSDMEPSTVPQTEPVPVDASKAPSVAAASPYDPCLPGVYTDWQEFSREDAEKYRQFKWLRIHIDRSDFQLVLDGIKRDGSIEEIYRTHVALGDVNSPTPVGKFVINHVYCYPDVVFFDPQVERVADLYNGFFAPLLLCDDGGRCERYRELGMHGFEASAIPPGRHISPAVVGAVSAGCIRIPDPCKFKMCLIRAAGLGGLKQNDRGSYHWLRRPVEVVITDGYPDSEETNLASIIEQGVTHLQEGLKNILDVFR